MGYAILYGSGGGGVNSDDVTAKKENVLAGKTALTSDSGDEAAEGTMPNNGSVSHSLPVNGTYTIPKGYHDGTGKVTQALARKDAETYYAKTTDQTIAGQQYLNAAQIIKKLTQTNLSPGNILNGTTIKINNGDKDVWSVTGTRVTPVRNTYVVAAKGYGASPNVLSDEDTYTMPRAGVVYFGAAVVGYGGTPKAKAELLVNDVVKKTTELTGQYSSYAYTYDLWQSENVAANDVVKVRVTITQGTHVFAILGAHMAC